MSASHVKQWQNWLIQHGFLVGGADGQFGPKTLSASLSAGLNNNVTEIPGESKKKQVVERIGDTQLIIDECKRQGLLRNQTAYVLATAYWETARTMKPVVEAYWLSESWRKRNLRYYPWYGRGYVQLTWEFNYLRAENKLGIPFTEGPDLALEPEHAVKILVTGMVEGWFTGKKLTDYITIDYSNFVGARRMINGTDKAKTIAAIAVDYDNDLKEEMS